jgi:hypothetical protein
MKSILLSLVCLCCCIPSFAVGPISGDTIVCPFNSTHFSDTTIGGVWSSSDPSIATVNSTGDVSGINTGSATITYLVGGSYATKSITVVPAPNVYLISSGGVYCAGSPGLDIFLNGSQTGVSYQLYGGSSPVGTPMLGYGGVLDFGENFAGNYEVIAYDGYTGCSDNMAGVSTVRIATSSCVGRPDLGTVLVSSPTTCFDSVLFLNLSSLQCGVAYQWQFSSDETTWTNFSGATAYSYNTIPTASLYYRAIGTCLTSSLSSASLPVYVAANPSVSLHTVINTSDTICNNPAFQIEACNYVPGMNVTTYFGDGTWQNTILSSAYAMVSHAYSSPGTYSVKQVLYDTTSIIDSSTFSYEFNYCKTLPIKIFYDVNADSIYDGGDILSQLPFLIEIDSNGISIDTISATSGFYFQASGGPGTIYAFKILSRAGGFAPTLPSTGILYDTIQSYVNNYPVKYFGYSCASSTEYDLSEHALLLCGFHSAGGTVIVNNAYCAAETASFTVNYSPKYTFNWATPIPASHTSTSITWNLGSLSSSLPAFPIIRFALTYSSSYLTIGDTVHSSYSITPIAGDADTTNNVTVRCDTVKAGYDPNEMSVTPQGYILPCSKLQYTINFENTGNAPATNISVLDTLPDNVSPQSLRIIAASAAMNISLLKYGTHTVAKFDFPNINLLDSSHHGACDGMVVFTVNSKDGLADGTPLYNRAGIYFDDNPVVMTGTVENIIGIGSIMGSDHVCRTQNTTLADQTEFGIWSSGNPSIASATDGLVSGLSPGVATISYTVTNSCASRIAIKSITVDSSVTPLIRIRISPSDTSCSGSLSLYSAAITNGGSAPIYQWKVNGVTESAGPSYSYIPANGDIISVWLKSNANCAIPDTAIHNITMSVLPELMPTVSVTSRTGAYINVGQVDTFTASVSNGGISPTYQWEVNSTTIPGATSAMFVSNTFFDNDVVDCAVTPTEQCGTSARSNYIRLNLYNVGIGNVDLADRISLSPNPTKSTFIISQAKGMELVIYDLLGKEICKTSAISDSQQIDISSVAKGVYSINIIDPQTKQRTVLKLVKD